MSHFTFISVVAKVSTESFHVAFLIQLNSEKRIPKLLQLSECRSDIPLQLSIASWTNFDYYIIANWHRYQFNLLLVGFYSLVPFYPVDMYSQYESNGID